MSSNGSVDTVNAGPVAGAVVTVGGGGSVEGSTVSSGCSAGSADGAVATLDGGFTVTSLLVTGMPQPDAFVIEIMPRVDTRNINNTFFIVIFCYTGTVREFT